MKQSKEDWFIFHLDCFSHTGGNVVCQYHTDRLLKAESSLQTLAHLNQAALELMSRAILVPCDPPT